MTIGALIGGVVLRRFGPTVLWSGTFVIAIIAVALYFAISRTITRRITSESDTAEDQLTGPQPLTIASPSNVGGN